MITPLVHWFAHVWAALAAITARDWPYYLLALPVVGVIAWFTLPSEDVDGESQDERECRYW